MPKFEIIYKIQKTYRMIVDCKDEDEAEQKAIDEGLDDKKSRLLLPTDCWVCSITEMEE